MSLYPEAQEALAARQLRVARRAHVRNTLQANAYERRQWWKARPRVERLAELTHLFGRFFLPEYETWPDTQLAAAIVDGELEAALALVDANPSLVPGELARLRQQSARA